jgi:N-acetylmuramoyl-L-alanine amidase
MTGASDRLLPYHDRLTPRPLQHIELVVIHCTELPDLATARAWGERIVYAESGTGNSGHYYIDRDGQVQCWVRPDRVAHHVRRYNERSVGIELVNNGRWPDWLDSRRQDMSEPYPRGQVDALLRLLAELKTDLPGLRWVAGHDELDTEQVPAGDDPARRVSRKRDPGPLFPWDRVISSGLLARFPVEVEE